VGNADKFKKSWRVRDDDSITSIFRGTQDYSGSTVEVVLLEGELVVKPLPKPISKPKYTLAELLAQCDTKAEMSKRRYAMA
jgi:hypothetical protein